MRLTRIIDLHFLACVRNLYILYSGRTQSIQEKATAMKKRPAVVLGGVLTAMLATAAFVTLSLRTQEASAVGDPRQEPPMIRLVTAAHTAICRAGGVLSGPQ